MSPRISRDLAIYRISRTWTIREDSDYDDEYVVKPQETQEQIETAKELAELVETYISGK